jgi:hypothetical protein
VTIRAAPGCPFSLLSDLRMTSWEQGDDDRQMATKLLSLKDSSTWASEGVSWRTIQRAEASERMHIATLEKIQQALEAAGVEFLQRSNSGVGVRLRR